MSFKTLNNQIKRAIDWTQKEVEEKDVQELIKIYAGANISLLDLAMIGETYSIEKLDDLNYQIIVSAGTKKVIILIKIKVN